MYFSESISGISDVLLNDHNDTGFDFWQDEKDANEDHRHG